MSATLLSPMVLFFGLGAVAAFARSDLTIPEAAGKAMAIYLMVAIGLKGGVAVAAEGSIPAPAPTEVPTLVPAPTAVPTVVPTAVPTAVPTSVPTPTAVPAPRYDLVLVGGTLIDSTGAPPLENAAIGIQGRRIVQIGSADALRYSADTTVVDVRGATIMPGFINSHVHITGLTDDDLRRWTRAGKQTPRAATVSRRSR